MLEYGLKAEPSLSNKLLERRRLNTKSQHFSENENEDLQHNKGFVSNQKKKETFCDLFSNRWMRKKVDRFEGKQELGWF